MSLQASVIQILSFQLRPMVMLDSMILDTLALSSHSTLSNPDHSSILPLMPILTVFLMTLFTGRAKTENVGVWDIRPRKLVYDLSTDSGVSYGYRDAETPVSFETVTETRAGILPGQREIFMMNSFTGRCMMLAQQSLLRYSFKPDANTAFVQKYGNASPDSGRSYASW
ncbi:hypothetical protein ABKN59_011573 [Abortiporus biennis]